MSIQNISGVSRIQDNSGSIGSAIETILKLLPIIDEIVWIRTEVSAIDLRGCRRRQTSADGERKQQHRSNSIQGMLDSNHRTPPRELDRDRLRNNVPVTMKS